MYRRRRPTAVMIAALAVIITVSGSGTVLATSDSDGLRAEESQTSGSSQYVVVFNQDIESGIAAVESAGGEVIDVTEPLGVALVTAGHDGFLNDVRAAEAVSNAVPNVSVGTAEPSAGVTLDDDWQPKADGESDPRVDHRPSPKDARAEPLADLQWGMAMIGATPSEAHRKAMGRGVTVGVIDSGVDASHPDIAPNFDHEQSRNFTMDIPELDGPCEVPTCIDPPDVDDSGHGTHVAGIIGAARNDFGVAGVAPDVTLVNLRAGQDSGFFFLYGTVAALVEAGDLGLDVVNMSYFVDPWLYNCTSADDYVDGDVTDAELAEQATARELVFAALDYAHARDVTLVSSAGNEHTDLSAPERFDDTSPDFPPDSARPRTVTSDCLTLPTEHPDVIVTGSVGPSTRKADISNYGLGSIDVAGPGGWQKDFIGTPDFDVPENRVLSSVPVDVALANGWVDQDLKPLIPLAVTYCDPEDTCAVYLYAQGTSMASPHAAGVASLIIQRHGHPTPGGGRTLDPGVVAEILAATATDRPCPEAGFEDYTPEGRPADWNAVCEGTDDDNGLYGEGIVSAANAVQ